MRARLEGRSLSLVAQSGSRDPLNDGPHAGSHTTSLGSGHPTFADQEFTSVSLLKHPGPLICRIVYPYKKAINST